MTEPTVAILAVEHVTVRQRRDTLLDDVSLSVPRGTIHGITGPNGAGKSTLLAAVLGRLPFEGRIRLNWIGAGRIGYVPQTFVVDPTLPLTVEDFLALTRQRRPVCLGVTSSARRRIAALLDWAGLTGLAHRPLAVLSGGELRRVLLAHALEPEPELLVLDEPAAGLDDVSSRWLGDALADLRREGRVTTLLVSHDVEEIGRVTDAVTMLDRRVVAHGPTGELIDRLAHAAAGRSPYEARHTS